MTHFVQSVHFKSPDIALCIRTLEQKGFHLSGGRRLDDHLLMPLQRACEGSFASFCMNALDIWPFCQKLFGDNCSRFFENIRLNLQTILPPTLVPYQSRLLSSAEIIHISSAERRFAPTAVLYNGLTAAVTLPKSLASPAEARKDGERAV